MLSKNAYKTYPSKPTLQEYYLFFPKPTLQEYYLFFPCRMLQMINIFPKYGLTTNADFVFKHSAVC